MDRENAAESIERDGEITIRTSTPAAVEITDDGQGIGLIFIREVLVRHGCTFSLRTYADGLTKFRILFS